MLDTILISHRTWDYISEGAVKSLDSVAVANACQTDQSELCQLNGSPVAVIT